MAVTAVPGSLIGRFSRDATAVRARMRAAKSGATRHVLTGAALLCGTGAAFSHSGFAGLIALGASLLVLDYKIQG